MPEVKSSDDEDGEDNVWNLLLEILGQCRSGMTGDAGRLVV